MTVPRRKPRLSAEETRDRLVAACVHLLKRRGVKDVSVREVAALAKVNHGLVHRLFGSKEGLVAAAIRRISDDVHSAGPSGAVSGASFAYLRRHPEVARLVARACLDGPSELLGLAAPGAERLAEITGQIAAAFRRAGLGDAIDPHLVNALATAALLGWFAFRPLLRRGFGLPDDADDRLAALLALVDNLVVG